MSCTSARLSVCSDSSGQYISKLIVVLSGRHWSCITFLVLVVMVVIETVVAVVVAVFVASSWGLFFTMVAARSSEIALRFALERSCAHTVLNAFPP